jgi:hypothetical protein
MKHLVDVALKGSRAIAEAKRQHAVLVVAVPCAEGCQILYVFVQAYAIEGLAYVKLSEHSRARKPGEGLLDQ